MTADGSVLVLGREALAKQLASGGRSGFTHCGDSYQALQELARHPYSAVMLDYPAPDFVGLLRAVRRLAPKVRTFALCTAAGEAELRLERPSELDDYFIDPLSPEDLAKVFQPSQIEGGAEQVGATGPEARDIAGLVEACVSMKSLAEAAAQLAQKWAGQELAWEPADDQRGQALLLLGSEPPQVLLATSPLTLAPAVRAKLQALQILLGPLAAQVRRIEALHRLAITDHLTGAYNRRYFYHFTDQLLGRARRERFRVTLLLFDIDDFKSYNDTYGHAVGDEILRQATELLRTVTRQHDIVARIGGDEFAVLFWDHDPPRRPDSRHPESPRSLADRFVAALRKHTFPSLGPDAKGMLTISGGLATFPWDGQDCRELLRFADRGLREVKTSGKNAIYLVGEAE